MGTYRTAQICLNGHVVTTSADQHPELREIYCSTCGVVTTTTCAHCETPIRGSYHVPGVFGLGGDYEAPTFCYRCGRPFPWTESRLAAAQKLTDELDELNVEDRQMLMSSLSDLMRVGPTSEVAALRVKKIARKLGAESLVAFKSVVTDILSETARKTLGL